MHWLKYLRDKQLTKPLVPKCSPAQYLFEEVVYRQYLSSCRLFLRKRIQLRPPVWSFLWRDGVCIHDVSSHFGLPFGMHQRCL
jgi:hypothetical protein